MGKLSLFLAEKYKSRQKERQKMCERLFYALLNNMEHALILVHNDKIFQVNKQVVELLNYPENEISEIPFTQLIADDAQKDYSDFITLKNAIISTPEDFNPVRLIKKDGTTVNVRLTGKYIDELDMLQLILYPSMEISEKEIELRDPDISYRELFNASSSIIYIHDFNSYDIIDINEQAIKISGYEYGTVIGMHIDTLIQGEPPYSAVEAKEYLDKVKKTGQLSFEWLAYYQNKPVWTNNTMKVATIKGKKIILVIATDITDKKLTMLELEKTRKLLEAAIMQSPSGIILADAPSADILLINSVAKKIFGNFPKKYHRFKDSKSSEIWQILAANGQVIPDDDLPLPRAIFKGETTSNLDLMFIHQKKEKKWISAHAAPIHDANGNIIAGILIFQDISEKILTEKKLDESTRMLQTILDTIPVRVFWKDLQYRFLGCNRLFLKDAGLTDIEQILGKNDYDLSWKNEADLYRADDMAVVQSGKAKLNFEETQTTPENKTIWLKTSKIPLRDEAGEIFGVMGTYEDITRQKIALQELEKHKANLEILIQERTEEIHDMNEILKSTNQELSVKNEELKMEIEVRKRIESDLQDSEDKLRQFLQQSGEAIQLLDDEGRIIEWNNRSELLFEYKKNEMIGQYVYDFEYSIQPDHKKTNKQYQYIKNSVTDYYTSPNGLKPINLEYSIKTKSGKHHDLRIIIFPIYTSKGLLVGRICLDITENKKAEAELKKYKNHLEDLVEQRTFELKQNEERLSLVMRSMPMAFYTLNIAQEAAETWISEQITNLSGYTPEDFKQESFWRNNLHNKDKEQVIQKFDQIDVSSPHLATEYRWKIADGTYRWFLDQASLVEDENGVPLKIIGSILDITERKIAEESIIESERNYRAIFNASADAIFVYDAESGSLIDVNDSMLELYGCTYKEALTLPFEAFNEGKAPFNFETTRILMDKALEEGSYQYEWRSRKKNGTLFWSEIRLKRMVIGDKDRIVALVRDITERKQSESTIKYRLNYELLISEISSQFINMPPEEVDISIESALKEIASFIQSDCCYIFIFDESSNNMRLSHLWKNNKIAMDKENLAHIPLEGLEWHLHQFYEDQAVVISNIKHLPDEAANAKNIISSQNINSLADVPLVFQGNIIGFLGVGSTKENRRWNNDEISLLRIVGQIFMNALQRKNIINHLLVSERTHREIFNATNEAIFIQEISSGKIEDANLASQILFNYSYDELINRYFKDLVIDTSENAQENIAKLIKKANKEGSHVAERKVQKKEGEEFWVEISLKKAQIMGKNKMLSVIRDITERRRTENLLRESEERFRSIVQQLSDIVMVLDKNTIISYETPSLSKILGYKEGFMTGKKIIDFIHPDDIDLLFLRLEQLTNNKSADHSIEVRIKNSEGNYLFMELLGNNLLNHPSIHGFVITCRNITERKMMEKKILETIIKTEEKERERFAKNLHDDLGPLLSSIKMYVNSISSSGDPERSAFIVEQLNEIVKEAINTTKEVSNDLSPHILINYGLVSALESFISRISAEIEIEFNNNIKNRRIPQEIETSVYRIIKELINNTIKHADADEVKLEITETNNTLYIEYSDNGKGFDESQLKQESGMGISNIISRARSMNGKYSFSMRKKNGMKFMLEVPISEVTINTKAN